MSADLYHCSLIAKLERKAQTYLTQFCRLPWSIEINLEISELPTWLLSAVDQCQQVLLKGKEQGGF